MELLVRIVDRSDNPLASKYGDCIVSQEDGWVWSPAELINHDWVIIRSSITKIESESLQQALTNAATNDVLAFRRYTVDLNSLGIQPRPQSDLIIEVTAPELRAVVVEKP
jgi:hypothetical protein